MTRQESEQCRKGEHPWISTTAPNFRRCGESGCHVTQRLHNGVWSDVEMVKAVKKKSNKLTPSSLCEDTGKHDWISTTASNYRKCCRSGCTATQHMIHGEWIDAGSETPQREPVKSTPQATMWG